jgi:hypothetical protein
MAEEQILSLSNSSANYSNLNCVETPYQYLKVTDIILMKHIPYSISQLRRRRKNAFSVNVITYSYITVKLTVTS